jgi:hypothetical protein
VSVNDISAVVATRDYATARAWYSSILGRDPDLEPIDGVAEWQITATAWLQLVEDADRAGKSAAFRRQRSRGPDRGVERRRHRKG